jgi:hypothetical protein
MKLQERAKDLRREKPGGCRHPKMGGLGKAPRNPRAGGVLVGSVGPDSAPCSPYGCRNLTPIDTNVEEYRRK